MPVEEKEYKGYTIEIHTDDNPANTREEWDNLATMVCWHSRYTLGDKDGQDLLLDAVRSSSRYREGWDDCHSESYHDLTEPRNLIDTAEQCPDILMLPLYLYDHSGITMRCHPFSCRWDSGMVGVIFITHDRIRKECSRNTGNNKLKEIKRVSKKDLERVKRYLEGEVETYDDYLTGSVYGYVAKDSDGNEIDSCWGYYGYDHKKSGLWESATSAVDYDIKHVSEEVQTNGIQFILPGMEKFATKLEGSMLAVISSIEGVEPSSVFV